MLSLFLPDLLQQLPPMISDSEHRAVKVIVIRKSLPFVLQALSLLLALQQIVLDRVRRDAAMRWLIDNNMLEREEEEAENQRSKGKDLPDYDYVYGSVFSITDHGRELLEEIWEEQRQQ